MSLAINAYNWLFNCNYQDANKRRTTPDPNVNADIAIMGFGTEAGSQSKITRLAQQILAKAGFKEVHTHGFGTNVSGPLSKLDEALHKMIEAGREDPTIPRFSVRTTISVNKQKNQSIANRLAAIQTPRTNIAA